MLKKSILGMFLLLTLLAQGQENKKFNYGFNVSYNHSLIKPAAKDNFLSKPGVGFSSFLEFDYSQKIAINAGFGFSNTKIEHENLFFTHSVNSIDMPINFNLHQRKNSGFHIQVGFMPSYVIQAIEKPLVGPTSDIVNFSSLKFSERMDYGLQLGFGIDLKAGTRLKVNYIEFLNSDQSSDAIGLKHDHLQFSLEVRFRDFKVDPNTERQAQRDELRQLKDSGCILFVVSTKLPSNYAREMTEDEISTLDSLRDLATEYQIRAIKAYYTSTPFAIIKDTDYPNYLKTNNSNLLVHVSENLTFTMPYWPCMLGEHVYKLNDKATTGIHLYRKTNQPFTTPFLGYTAYRTPDKEFKNKDEIFSMVMRFNEALTNVFETEL